MYPFEKPSGFSGYVYAWEIHYLTIKNVQIDDIGNYTLIADNGGSFKNLTFTLDVIGKKF